MKYDGSLAIVHPNLPKIPVENAFFTANDAKCAQKKTAKRRLIFKIHF